MSILHLRNMVQLRQKLNRTNGLQAKLRHHVSSSLLKTIYFEFFDFHLRYATQIWGQRSSNVMDIVKTIQNKALWIISLKDKIKPSRPLYAHHNILKLQNVITLNNCLFIFDQLCENLPNTFLYYFKLNLLKISTGITQKVSISSP